MHEQFIQGEDYYLDENGLIVLTKKYLLQRDCCGNGCKHCPYDYANVPEPKKSKLISLKNEIQQSKNNNIESEI